jgi:hypothetical protein
MKMSVCVPQEAEVIDMVPSKRYSERTVCDNEDDLGSPPSIGLIDTRHVARECHMAPRRQFSRNKLGGCKSPCFFFVAPMSIEAKVAPAVTSYYLNKPRGA